MWRSPQEILYGDYPPYQSGYFGNYYSDHDHTDLDNNKVTDTAYDLPGEETEDSYSLTFPNFSFTSNNNFYVDDNGSDLTGDGSQSNPWKTIQYAIDRPEVKPGDALTVSPGTYVENIKITKQVWLWADNISGPVVVAGASPEDHVIEVMADYVSIAGFTIYGATGSSGDKAGIHLAPGTDNCQIFVNRLGYYGMPSNAIGIKLTDARHNVIGDNECWNSTTSGIWLSGSIDNQISGNTTHNCQTGIYLSNSGGNNIYTNSFINSAIESVESYNSINSWQSPFEINYAFRGNSYQGFLGNYYSDHNNLDANGDGLADIPYILPGNEAADNRALAVTMAALNNPNPPVVTITSPVDGSVLNIADGAVQFLAAASDPEDGDLSGSVTWHSSIDGDFTSPKKLSIGAHTITATVTDSGGWSATATITLTVNANLTFRAVASEGTVLSGLKVYAFTEAGSYTSKNKTTDANGAAVFDMTEFANGRYKFRLDYLGQQFWSNVVVIPNEKAVTLVIQEAPVTITVGSDSGSLAGIPVYLFSAGDAYLGRSLTTAADGKVVFKLPVTKNFKFRCDYQGYQFWSSIVTAAPDVNVNVLIPHRAVVVNVAAVFNTQQPLSGVRVYLFTSAGAYMNQYRLTDATGSVTFLVPEKGYKFRIDYLNQQYWSDVVVWQNVNVQIPMADALITVSGNGQALAGVKVYAFSATGSYLNLSGSTDANGRFTFRLPAGNYRFRADYLGNQYWSNQAAIIAGQSNPIDISTGGGSFVLTLLKNAQTPLAGIKCYVFNGSGSYLGLNATSDTEGRLSFQLPTGAFRFRADYRGYQFWSDTQNVPAQLSCAFTIPHQDISLTVNSLFQDLSTPMPNLNVYLFTSGGAHLENSTTNAQGACSFNLPNQPYKFRVDYLGVSYWSTVIQWQNTLVEIPMAKAEIQVTAGGQPRQGVAVYVFNKSNAYLNINGTTNAEGKIVFQLPVGEYNFRGDYNSNQYWTGVGQLLADQLRTFLLQI